ncbi:MAG: SRPBCC family protein [Chitinophagales bacterium]
MAEYRFITLWQFDAPVERVYDAVHNADNYHLWWKGQDKVLSVAKGDFVGRGAIKRFTTRSVLPYSLVYDGLVLDVIPYKKIEGTTTGDLQGHGVWTFEQLQDSSLVKYYWNVKTTGFWMNLLAPVLKPVFAWNHDVVMKWGGEGLANYLGCRLLLVETERRAA